MGIKNFVNTLKDKHMKKFFIDIDAIKRKSKRNLSRKKNSERKKRRADILKRYKRLRRIVLNEIERDGYSIIFSKNCSRAFIAMRLFLLKHPQFKLDKFFECETHKTKGYKIFV